MIVKVKVPGVPTFCEDGPVTTQVVGSADATYPIDVGVNAIPEEVGAIVDSPAVPRLNVKLPGAPVPVCPAGIVSVDPLIFVPANVPAEPPPRATAVPPEGATAFRVTLKFDEAEPAMPVVGPVNVAADGPAESKLTLE